MARPKTITISLTPKQRTQIKKLTGEEHTEMKLERSALGVKSAPKRGPQLREGIALAKRGGITLAKKGGITLAKKGGITLAKKGGITLAKKGGITLAKRGGITLAKKGLPTYR